MKHWNHYEDSFINWAGKTIVGFCLLIVVILAAAFLLSFFLGRAIEPVEQPFQSPTPTPQLTLPIWQVPA